MAIDETTREETRTATIESLVTDQGNGGSRCGHCETRLDEYLTKRTAAILANPNDPANREPYTCPGCSYALEYGSVGGNFGGSDF